MRSEHLPALGPVLSWIWPIMGIFFYELWAPQINVRPWNENHRVQPKPAAATSFTDRPALFSPGSSRPHVSLLWLTHVSTAYREHRSWALGGFTVCLHFITHKQNKTKKNMADNVLFVYSNSGRVMATAISRCTCSDFVTASPSLIRMTSPRHHWACKMNVNLRRVRLTNREPGPVIETCLRVKI